MRWAIGVFFNDFGHKGFVKVNYLYICLFRVLLKPCPRDHVTFRTLHIEKLIICA